MIILTLRTDKPEAEVGLYENTKQLGYLRWQAHRELSDTLHVKVKELLDRQGKDWQAIQGVVVYKGSGSFTGLRIGVSVANMLAASLSAPIVGETGEDWRSKGCQRLMALENDVQVLPEYGADPHITPPRK